MSTLPQPTGTERRAYYGAEVHYPTAESLAKALGGRRNGRGYKARCPAHDDAEPSLDITEKDGKTLFVCRAGCEQAAVLSALVAKGAWPERAALNGASAPKRSNLGPIVATYDYVDEHGTLLVQKTRHDPKTFRQRRPNGNGGWISNADGVRRLIYRLPDVIEAVALGRVVFVVEGEKDADRLWSLGIPATCNIDGASKDGARCKWKAEDSEHLRGADVVVIPDNDDAGRAHANGVASSLQGVAERVRLIALPNLRDKGDVSDWLDGGGTGDMLAAMAETAREWRPATPLLIWPAPDMTVCERSHEKPPQWPVGGFGALDKWIAEAAESASAPADYVGLALLSGASGTIGGRLKVSPWQGWEEPCIIWGALVGDPSVNKSPAADPVRAAIMAAEEHKAADYTLQMADFETRLATSKAIRKAWEKAVEKAIKDKKNDLPKMPAEAAEPQRPVRPRCVVVNITTEKLARALAEDPGGLAAWNDELAGLIGSFDRYGGGGLDKAFWLECYGGRPYRLDRVKDGTIDVPCTAAALFGSIQPDRLNTLVLAGDNDGFASRFLYAWPDPRERRRPRTVPGSELLGGAFKRLVGLRYPGKVLPLAREAADAFEHWWTGSHDADIKTAPGVLAEAYSKMSGGALRIALALECLWWATDHARPEPVEVSTAAIAHSLILIDEWAKPMARRVLSEASIPRSQLRATSLARWIRANRPAKINARNLLRRHRGDLPGIRESKDMDEACATLVEAGFLRPAGTRDGDTRGRATKDFEVNPALQVGA